MIKRQSNRRHKKADKSSDDSSGEETELFVKHKSPKREIPSVEKTIDENDTLQSLAIRHHCTIEDLKRLNNIHKDNEIYARRTIRVPYRPFSEALLAPIHVSGSSSPQEPATGKLIDIDTLQSKLEPRLKDTSNEVNQIIFNSSISSINREADPVSEDSIFLAEEDVDLLPQATSSDLVRPEDSVISGLSCNGSDWDISYPALIVCIVLVIFAIPLIYVVYIAEHRDIYHNHTHHLNTS